MTHHTDAELLPCPFCGDHAETDFIPEHHSYAIECHSMGCAARVIKDTASDAIEAWNRRAPAAPVPDVTDAMIEAANEAYCPFGDMHLAIQAALAAAPQPPEAAPVQLPEPSAWMLGCQTMGGDVGWRLSWSKSGAGVCHRLSGEEFEHPLYTEQQVRQLLANHGIQERST